MTSVDNCTICDIQDMDATAVSRSYKVFLMDGREIRRFNASSLTWDDFVEVLEQIFQGSFHPELKVQYVDADGDRITISSQIEWAEAMTQFGGDATCKFYVGEGSAGPNGYFKDGPPAIPIGLYEELEDGTKRPVEGEEGRKYRDIERKVPQCLANWFHQGKILPYNLPTWLQERGVVKILTLENGEVDLDINVPALYNALHDKGLDCLTKLQYKEGLQFLQDALSISPENPVCSYNVACAESLLGEVKKAAEYLKEAVRNGYANVQQMLEDEDLANLRSTLTDEFRSIVSEIKTEFTGFTLKKVEPTEEQVEEQEKQPMEEDTSEELANSLEQATLEAINSSLIDEAVDIESDFEEVASDLSIDEGEWETLSDPESADSALFAAQLQQLDEMGFQDHDLNISLLKESNGNVPDVVRVLLR